MPPSVTVKSDHEATAQTLSRRVELATQLATTAFNHALNWPNATTLAAVDRSIELLNSFMQDAQRLKMDGRPAVHDRLAAVLVDLTMGRARLGAPPANNATQLLADTKIAAAERAKAEAKRKKQMEDDAAAFEAKQKELRKML